MTDRHPPGIPLWEAVTWASAVTVILLATWGLT